MNFKQRSGDSGIEGKKYTDSMTPCWPHSYKKHKSSPHFHSSPGGIQAFLDPKKDPSCDKVLTWFWWLKQKVKQEAISSPSSMPRGAILDRGRPWRGIKRPDEYKHRKHKINRKLVPNSLMPNPPALWFPWCHLFNECHVRHFPHRGIIGLLPQE